MLASLFKPKWRSANPDIRLGALEKLDPARSRDREALVEVVKNDSESRVRLAAVRRIKDRELLDRLIKASNDEGTRDALMRQRINTVELDEVKAVGEQSTLLDIALLHQVAKVRLAAAEQVAQPGLLEVLAKESKDKAVQRHVRDALKGVKAERQAQEQRSAEIDRVIDAMEKLVGRSDIDPLFLSKFEQADKQWQPFKREASEKQQQRFNSARKACASDVEAIEAAERAQRDRQVAQEQLDQLLTGLAGDLKSAENVALGREQLEQHQQKTRSEWQRLSQLATPSEAQQRRLDDLMKTLDRCANTLALVERQREDIDSALAAMDALDEAAGEEQLEALRAEYAELDSAMTWPKQLAAPAVIRHWQSSWQRLREIESARQEKQGERIRKLASRRRQLDAHIEQGELGRANRVHSHIHYLLKKLDDERELERQQQRLQPLEEKLQKLRDWHGFSTEPKKEDLCQRMEALVEGELAPLDRAEAVKALRGEWREQTAVNLDKEDPLTLRFEAAAEKAWAPCAEYFAQLDQIQRDNLQKRRVLCEQLEQFAAAFDWENPDWKALDKALKTARDEWKSYEPVRFADAKPVQALFFATLNPLNERLKNYWQDNLEAKQKLLEQAKPLVEMDDLDEAIQRCIDLQNRWKQVGPTFRSRDPKVWRAFRKACDAVFARRDAERQEQRAENDEHIARAEALVDQMRDLSKLSDAELPEAHAKADELQEAFDQIDMPPKVARALADKMQRAHKAYEQQLAGIADRQQQQQMRQLADVAAQFDQQESHAIAGGSVDVDAVEAAVNALPKADQTLLSDRLATLKSDKSDQTSETAKDTLEKLAIEMEVLMDVETPPDFKGERMAYQLDKLPEEMGLHSEPEDQALQLNELRRQWYAQGPVSMQDREALQARLEAVLAKSVPA
ncbi:conserved hypothetical protein [gamma proteobacterium HTCC5015]|nr:conserved hypothetical protein [gamma proteobacterium HTCC5015]